MNVRTITRILLTATLMGLLFALLWVQAGLPAPGASAAWAAHVDFFPSVYAAWLPALYLFFFMAWWYLLRHLPDNRHVRAYWRYDGLSYGAVVGVYLVQISWQKLGQPHIWLRGVLLALLVVKSAGVLRALYQAECPVRPAALGAIGVGIHALLIPFHDPILSRSLPMLLQPQELTRLAILALKILGLNLMALEMFRLSKLLSRSARSAMVSWWVVLFTFPVLGYPKSSHIVGGLLLIFILRLIFSRLDTRELMVGLVQGRNMMILLKALVVLALMLGAGMIFWSNVKPGFGLHGVRAAQAALLTLFDAQGGLFCYTPLYWLTLFGMVYVVFFRIWDGVLLLLTCAAAYGGYHVLAYGILDRVIDPTVAVPFLPIFGVFLAIAHARFGRMRLFRYLLRLGTVITVAGTLLFLLLLPSFQHIQSIFSEMQRLVRASSGLDLAAWLPATVFRPLSLKTTLWLGLAVGAAVMFCLTRTGYWRAMFGSNGRRPGVWSDMTFAPVVVLTCLTLGMGGAALRRPAHDVPLPDALAISRHEPKQQIELEQPVTARRLRVVGYVSAGAAWPHHARIARITVFGQGQRFKNFDLRMGEDLADTFFEHPDIRPIIAHGRAALYRSWPLDVGDGRTFTAHTYYTELVMPRQLKVERIVITLTESPAPEMTADTTMTIQALTLLE